MDIKENYANANLCEKTKRRWSNDEVRMIIEYDISDAILAKKLGHSENAIRARRYRLRQNLREFLEKLSYSPHHT